MERYCVEYAAFSPISLNTYGELSAKEVLEGTGDFRIEGRVIEIIKYDALFLKDTLYGNGKKSWIGNHCRKVLGILGVKKLLQIVVRYKELGGIYRFRDLDG